MSQGSRADYSIYNTLAGPSPTQIKLVAIVDAKKHITPHNTAQVIGYYSAFEINDPQPLALVMTEDSLKIIIFPFKVKDQHYVNAIELQEFSLWKVNDVGHKELDVGVLNLLLSLTDKRSVLRGYTIKPELADIPLKGQGNIGTIVTNIT